MQMFAVTTVVTTPPLNDDQLTNLRSRRGERSPDGSEFTVLAACEDPVSGAVSIVVATLIGPDADSVHVCERIASALNMPVGAVDPVARIARVHTGIAPDVSNVDLARQLAELQRKVAELTGDSSV